MPGNRFRKKNCRIFSIRAKQIKNLKSPFVFRSIIPKILKKPWRWPEKTNISWRKETGDFYKAYASFYPADVEELFNLFELVKEHETTKIYLNNKSIPYIQDLWLFLMWFYRVK